MSNHRRDFTSHAHSLLDPPEPRRRDGLAILCPPQARRLREPQAPAPGRRGQVPAHPRGDRPEGHRPASGTADQVRQHHHPDPQARPDVSSQPHARAANSPGHPPAARCDS
jgi:hypothetical protein